MPTLNLSDQEIDDVIAFLAWVSRIDTQGWPPRPILVRGSAVPGAATALGVPAPQAVSRIRSSSAAPPTTRRRRGAPPVTRSRLA